MSQLPDWAKMLLSVVAFAMSIGVVLVALTGSSVSRTEVTEMIAHEAPYLSDRSRIDSELKQLNERMSFRRQEVNDLQRELAELMKVTAAMEARQKIVVEQVLGKSEDMTK